ncbi:uncharacterized protein Z518_10908 [Rhinocladiella mackenziei CBS 650.93]|uniref:Rhinocladiella mackenziei CBS 650.93 unplaced genomic scaffold supercont1.10, whole genome shotgun sequence n=1 Tax=Rhinocladiella mackenziei CBS 650.93 TaxID=1442369 RepID=A0A0D2I9R3_9EURO|nr:uncharacterized protein Z518_10908 [Rhinocladiella mackenziei CBS 650.93]KIW99980.1 hypothetical protein Z518_10908 [Rhinocladiella mackenziei CBS 650.93]
MSVYTAVTTTSSCQRLSTGLSQSRFFLGPVLLLPPELSKSLIARPAGFAAGVVPPLGAYAMANRRASGDRPRNWPQESSSSQEELIVNHGTRIVKKPERRPKVPPPTERAQQDEGFARFLTSPAHQRVTAGGSIVPMEQRSRPPTFSLSQLIQTIDSDHKIQMRDSGVANNQTAEPGTVVQGMTKPDVEDNSTIQSQPWMPATTAILDQTTITAGINVNLIATSDGLAIDPTSGQPRYVQPFPSAPWLSGMYKDPCSLPNVPAFPGGQIPLSAPAPLPGLNGALPGPLSTPLMPYQGRFSRLNVQGTSSSGSGQETPDVTYGRHMLMDALGNFEDLDRQLKLLDRHCAMNECDPQPSEHRMAIVQLRSDAKSQITYWSDVLGIHPKTLQKPATGPPNSTLRVKAAVHVPLKDKAPPATLSTKPRGTADPNGDAPQLIKPQSSSKAERRIIPIITLPEMPETRKDDMLVTTVSSHGSVPVDEWGVRIGNAPDEIARRQNEMLETLIRGSSPSPQDSPHKSTDNVAIGTPDPSSNSAGLNDPAPGKEEREESDSEEWLPTMPGRAPASIEACYELQLDAMRLPKGFVSRVRLPDGTITEVRGHGLQRPPSVEMDDFERRYWTSKPTLTKEMTAKFVEVRAFDEEIPSNRLEEYLDFDKLNTKSNRVQTKENAQAVLWGNSSGLSDGRHSNHLQAGPDPQGRSDELRRKTYNLAPDPSGPSSSAFKDSTASSVPIWTRGDGGDGCLASEHSRTGRELSQEAVNDKGFSSAVDSQRHSIESIFSAVGKGRNLQPAPKPVGPRGRINVPQLQKVGGFWSV